MKQILNKTKTRVRQSGFSLLEVLVGLAIIAIALISGIKALTQTVQTQSVIHQQYLAMLSANDALNKIYLQKTWPEFAVQKTKCSQPNLPLVCIRTAYSTPNPLFRRVEIEVYAAQSNDPTEPQGQRLAKLTTVVFNYLTANL
jgi:general secretion pathway protein I